MRLPSLKILFASFLMCISFIANAQYKIPEKPNVLYPVYDEAGILSEAEKHLTKNSSNSKTLLLPKLKLLLSLLPKVKT